MNHHTYSPDLAPSDFCLFVPMKVCLVQKFQTGDELKRRVLNWLRSQDKTFYAAGISNLAGRWKKHVSVKGDYVGKEREFGDFVIYCGMSAETRIAKAAEIAVSRERPCKRPLFAAQDKAKPRIESIRGLNLVAVKLTTVRVTKLPL
jgi:predicted GIY-YIG superfamily endonuclease